MIARSPARWQESGWQRQLAHVVRDLPTLLRRLELDPEQAPAALRPHLEAARAFPVRVPLPYLERMRRGDWHDPLLLQVLPQARETLSVPGYDPDPLREGEANPVPGLIHKYHGRVLLIISGACAINCRYCFRRSFPYTDNTPGRAGREQALNYIAAHPEISEVILSGGDPLAADDRLLAHLAGELAAIGHLRRLRVHTRLPLVLPARVQPALVDWLSGSRLQPVLVLHGNHPREIDDEVRDALLRLRGAGVTLLNQTVLLRGVNDAAETLSQLSEALFAAGVLPYYLHLLDRVAGAAHFEVPEARARALLGELLGRLPGYLVPRLVRELPGAPAKLPLEPVL